MKTKGKRAIAAALMGATLLLSHTANGAVNVSVSETPGVSTQDGLMDEYVFSVNQLIGGDNVSGNLGQNPEILLFEGTWSATGPGASLLVPGDSDSSNNGYWTKYITKGATTPMGDVSSTVNLPNEVEGYHPSRTGGTSLGASYTSSPFTSSNVTGITGLASSFKASWYDSPTGGPHGGGIEASTTGDAAESRLATIYVTPGGGITFSGDYGTYNRSGLEQISINPIQGPPQVPEPCSGAGILTGAAALVFHRRKHHHKREI
jgi:hypothetical protein